MLMDDYDVRIFNQRHICSIEKGEKFRIIELKDVSEICHKCLLATIYGDGCRAREAHGVYTLPKEEC